MVTDPYANYAAQAIFQRCSQDQLARIIKGLAGSIPDLAVDKKGTHTLQALVGLLEGEQALETVVQALAGKVLAVANHNNGTHFLQKVMLALPKPCLEPLAG
jgi:hypothetical protein